MLTLRTPLRALRTPICFLRPRFIRLYTAESKSSNTPSSQPHSHTHDIEPHSQPPLHSHSHSHTHTHSSIDPEMLTARGMADPAVRITVIGLLCNVGMAIGKGVGGLVFHSHSLLADAVHAFSDLISDVLTLSTVTIAKKAPSKAFPHGYGRIETVGALGVSSMLVFAGLSMSYTSLIEICDILGVVLPALPVGHSHEHVPAEWSAALIALVSIGVKEALYQSTRRVALRVNSPVLNANAWHHRLDSMVSVVAVVSIGLGQIFQQAWLDPLGALLVSMLIVRAGWTPTVQAAQELCGSVKPVLDSEKYTEFKQRAQQELEDIAPDYEIVKCTLEPYGSTYIGSVQLKNVDARAVCVSSQLKQRLMRIKHMKQVYVRI